MSVVFPLPTNLGFAHVGVLRERSFVYDGASLDPPSAGCALGEGRTDPSGLVHPPPIPPTDNLWGHRSLDACVCGGQAPCGVRCGGSATGGVLLPFQNYCYLLCALALAT